MNDPGSDLRQLRFDTPVPVTFRLERQPQGKATPADKAHVTATLSEGYLVYTNRIRLGMGLQNGAAVASLLGRDTGSEPSRVVVEIGKTSASFIMAGASKAFAQFKRGCDAQHR